MLRFTLWLFCSFRGRISRLTFLLALAPLALGFAGAGRLAYAGGFEIAAPSLIGGLGLIAFVYVELALAAKRQHDFGWGALSAATPYVAPLTVGAWAYDAGEGFVRTAPFQATAVAAATALAVYFGMLVLREGEASDNDFGRPDVVPAGEAKPAGERAPPGPAIAGAQPEPNAPPAFGRRGVRR